MKRPDEYDDLEFDVREDEEQSVKLGQTVELLLAAGYFRARIHGLSPFDKVVGGMVWCISTCNYDVDVDLLFQENSTIGQKIALTEKIVAVLPRMKCPHQIEPHQIQGLDFIHIFPVVQWLVKRAIETREEMGDYVRAYSISQFDKHFTMPQDEQFKETKVKAVASVVSLKTAYGPKRRYKRQESAVLDEEARVQSTLLEYGRRGDLSAASQQKKKTGDKEGDQSKEEKQAEKERQEEERRIKSLMQGLAAMEGPQGKLTASAVGNIMGLQSEQIQQIASEYADKQSELAALEQSEHMSGAQHHQRQTASLQKQIQQQQTKLAEMEGKHAELQQIYEEAQQRLQKVEEHGADLEQQLNQLAEMETEENQSVLQSLRSLVAMNESLKRQEQEFRAHCKEELKRLQTCLEQLKQEGGLDTEDPEQSQLIDRQYQADRERLQKIRLLLAAKNREISGLQRKIDEVPSRAELSQYQRRFVELYNQVAAKHKETKQFYTLYNTLDDTKLYLNKEVSLLNSIHDTFEQAMASSSTKEQFLKQLEQIVEGVKQNRSKVEKRKQEEKMRRDQLNDTYIHLVDQQRLYFKTVKEFKEECRKNEILLTKVQR